MKRLTLGIVARPMGARLTGRVGLSLACGLTPTTALAGPVDVSALRPWQRLALAAPALLSLAAGGYALRTVVPLPTMISEAASYYCSFWAFLLLMLLGGVGEMWWRPWEKKDV